MTTFTNVKIEKVNATYFQVIADSERFGANEIVYEGTSLSACYEWLARNTDVVVELEETKYFAVKGNKNTYLIDMKGNVYLFQYSVLWNAPKIFKVSPSAVTKKVNAVISAMKESRETLSDEEAF